MAAEVKHFAARIPKLNLVLNTNSCSFVRTRHLHGAKFTRWKSRLSLASWWSARLRTESSVAGVEPCSNEAKLKGLSERGLRFVGDKAKSIGQPTPDSHPHLMEEDEITPGITKKEYRDRRQRLLSLLAKTHFGESHDKHLVIIPSNPTKFMTTDVPYPFRQNTDFLYLTGFQQPDAVLVLQSVEGLPLPAHKSTLFIQPHDPKKVLWEGKRPGTKDAILFFGFDESYSIRNLASVLIDRYAGKDFCVWYDSLRPTHPTIHEEISKVLFHTAKFSYKNLLVLGHNIHMLRLIKSDAEIKLLRESASLASRAITKVMRSTRPGLEESHLHTILEYECRMGGAERLAYPPVVASGPMANTLHYINNTQVLRDGELVLMDAGCEYHGYASDITRAWPVSGKFSDPQRELYELVLRVHKKCLKLCQKDVSLDYLHHAMLLLLGEELIRIDFLPKNLTESQLKKAAGEFCPHSVGHYLGMDTHDTHLVSKGLGLHPGMVITVEPGIYISENNKNVPERYRGIGIRIEDDVLITGNGPDVLTAECPKEVEDIERLMNGTEAARL
ncbi:probable Xaa-Pro aminopeptidase 3 isoform X2 [Orbicella faveolata]|uniref:probable Xaa-Pro aminopeptidase 3 isoform X2 n=1 Tax=Orbicella faveolata TaxID=48498 RepID=UPI0009E2B067|nr:probable Xaa-Pro aminopeptidase 3 isoform X2 [Orbicella faveolata]